MMFLVYLFILTSCCVVCQASGNIRRYEVPHFDRSNATQDNFLTQPYQTYWKGTTTIGIAILMSCRTCNGNLQRYYAADWVTKVVNGYNYLQGFKLKLCGYYFIDHIKSVPLMRKLLEDKCLIFIAGGAPQNIVSFRVQFTISPILIHVYDRRNYNDLEEYFHDLHMTFSVPGDHMRVIALSELRRVLKLNMYGTLSSSDNLQIANLFAIIPKNTPFTPCVAFKTTLPKQYQNEEEMRKIITKADGLKNLKTLVLFLNHNDTRVLLKVLKEKNLKDRFFLIFAYPTIKEPSVVRNHEDVLNGALAVDFYHRENLEFKNYFLNYLPLTRQTQNGIYASGQNYLRCFQENEGVVNRSTCKDIEYYEEGFGYFPDVSVSDIISCVNIVAQRLNRYVFLSCTDHRKYESDPTDKTCFLDHLLNRKKLDSEVDRRFKLFDEIYKSTTDRTSYANESTPWDQNLKHPFVSTFEYFSFKKVNKTSGLNYKFVNIGNWTSTNKKEFVSPAAEYRHIYNNYLFKFNIDFNKLLLPARFKSVSDFSRCSPDCEIGFRKEFDEFYPLCCWKCVGCKSENSYSIDEKCYPCRPHQVPNMKNKTCIDLPKKYLTRTNKQYKYITAISALCVIPYLASVIICMKHSFVFPSHQQISWFCMFIGIFISLGTPQQYFFPLDSTTCKFRFILTLLGIFFIVIFPLTNLLPPTFFYNHKYLGQKHANGNYSNITPSLISVFISMLLFGTTIALMLSHASLKFYPSVDKTFAFATCGIEVETQVSLVLVCGCCLYSIFGTVFAATKLFDKEDSAEKRLTCVVSSIYMVSMFILIIILYKRTKYEDYRSDIIFSWISVVLVFVAICFVCIPKIYFIYTRKKSEDMFSRNKSSSTTSYPLNPLLIENNANINESLNVSLKKIKL